MPQSKQTQQVALGQVQEFTTVLMEHVKYAQTATKELVEKDQQRVNELLLLKQELVTRDVKLQEMEAKH